MKPSGESTITASRLRAGDRLVAHQSATVTHPPVVSPDGSMVTVLLKAQEGQPLRVLRIPVEQPVVVDRPGPGPRKAVRKSKVARSSGAQIVVLDLMHPDSEIAPIDGNRYATLCTTHHAIGFHQSVSTAEAISSHPEEWCPECAAATRQRAQGRLGGSDRIRRLA